MALWDSDQVVSLSVGLLLCGEDKLPIAALLLPHHAVSVGLAEALQRCLRPVKLAAHAAHAAQSMRAATAGNAKLRTQPSPSTTCPQVGDVAAFRFFPVPPDRC